MVLHPLALQQTPSCTMCLIPFHLTLLPSLQVFVQILEYSIILPLLQPNHASRSSLHAASSGVSPGPIVHSSGVLLQAFPLIIIIGDSTLCKDFWFPLQYSKYCEEAETVVCDLISSLCWKVPGTWHHFKFKTDKQKTI